MKTPRRYADEVYQQVKKHTEPKHVWNSAYPDLRDYIEAQFKDAIEQARTEQVNPTPPATSDQD